MVDCICRYIFNHSTSVQAEEMLLGIRKCYSQLTSRTFPLRDNNLKEHSLLPKALCDPGILHGYRPTDQPWRYYFLSIFQLHNETLNIWTHLIGFFVLLHSLIYYKSFYEWGDKDWWPFFTFGISCMITHVFSVTAHSLHSKSERNHHLLFCLDYAGVTISGHGCGIAAFHCIVDEGVYRMLPSFFLPMYTFTSWFNFMMLCSARLIWQECNLKDSQKRKGLQLASVLVQCTLIFNCYSPRYLKCYVDAECSLTSLNHLTFPTITTIIAGFFYGSHLPEAVYPGKFDIVGQSHNLFHLMITGTQLLQMKAAHTDIQNGVPFFVEASSLTALLGSLFVLVVVELLSLAFLRHYISDSKIKCE